MHNMLHSQQTNIHAPGGIRTHNPTKRAAVDLRLRPLGHRNRRKMKYSEQFFCARVNNFSLTNNGTLSNRPLIARFNLHRKQNTDL